MSIDETHTIVFEGGPYPPGESAADYAECAHGCWKLSKPCMTTMPTDGWVPNEEPDWNSTQPEPDLTERCDGCGGQVGYHEAEYDGQYGLRMVLGWTDSWSHPKHDVTYCEDCTVTVEEELFG